MKDTRKLGGTGVFIIIIIFFFSCSFSIQPIRQYEPGTGYLLQPRPQVPFSWLWRWAQRWAHHLQSQGKATWGRGCTCREDHEPTIADRGRGGGGGGGGGLVLGLGLGT